MEGTATPRPGRVRMIAPDPFVITTPRGRRSPALAWSVKTAGGDRWRLSGLQRAALLWMTYQLAHGRHEWRIRDLADALGCSPGTASKIYRRLRSLSLIAGPRPVRGRHGHARTWIPRKAAQLRDHVARADRWPTFGNDSTLTTFGGFLTREGSLRSWSTMTGSPPVAAPPRRGGSPAGSPRARGRSWPPLVVDELCPSTRRRTRLRLATSRRSGPDVGAVWSATCSRCHRAHVATAAFVAPDPDPARRPGDRYPTPAQRLIAGELVALVDPAIADTLRERYLGWIRPPVYRPALVPLVDGPAGDLANLAAAAVLELDVALEAIASTRRLASPEGRQ